MGNRDRARAEEFRRLDVFGEGRLNYTTLKSALELRGENVPDSVIRKWIRDTDLGGKGYVDFDDFMHATKTVESAIMGADVTAEGSAFSRSDPEGERREVLRRAFARYDYDE